MSLINKIIQGQGRPQGQGQSYGLQGQGLKGWTDRIDPGALDSLRQVVDDRKIERLIKRLEKQAYRRKDREETLNELLLGEDSYQPGPNQYDYSMDAPIEQLGFRGLGQGMTEEDFHSLLNENVEVPSKFKKDPWNQGGTNHLRGAANQTIEGIQEYLRQALLNLSGYFK